MVLASSVKASEVDHDLNVLEARDLVRPLTAAAPRTNSARAEPVAVAVFSSIGELRERLDGTPLGSCARRSTPAALGTCAFARGRLARIAWLPRPGGDHTVFARCFSLTSPRGSRPSERSAPATPASSWRERSRSALSSAPISTARLVIHSQTRNTMTAASEP